MSGDAHPTKAKIFRLKSPATQKSDAPPPVETDGEAIHVQFNPTSLRIQRTNDSSGGATTRAQRRQRANEGHATLSLDLEFDTAEGGPGGQQLDVRTLTQQVRQFAEPPSGGKATAAPPRMRFEWGTFRFDGIVSSLTEEIDYFAPDGMPLRAKVSLSITGQDPAFEANQSGAGARTDRSDSSGAGPGSTPSSTPDRATSAQDGESVQQALSRLGLDPAAWRSAMAGLDSPLGLAAGAQVQVDGSASVSAGLGATAGFSAGVSAGASFPAGVAAGLQVGSGVDARVAAAAGATGSVAASAAAVAAAGFALSAAGGVSATTRGIAAARADAGVAVARASFAVPGPARAVGVLSAQAGAGAFATAAVDARASTYGRGVPLKPPARLRPRT